MKGLFVGVVSLVLSAGQVPADGALTTVAVPRQLPSSPASHLTGGIVASDHSIWIIAEDGGIYRLRPDGGYADNWFQASYYAGYPDSKHFYGIAEDDEGRIWVGTANRGVAVFDGASWTRIDRDQALSGERVFAITASPGGGVAIATSGGVDFYHSGKEAGWSHVSRAEGIPSDQIAAIAYGPDGEYWLAHECGGVSVKRGREAWVNIQAPWYQDHEQRVRQPVTPQGSGLPSNLCNAIVVDGSGTVWVGTNCGLACMRKGQSWRYIRGRDFADKNKGCFLKGAGSPTQPSAPSGPLLPEDYVTCLRTCADGLWVGFRTEGAVLLDPRTLKVVKHVKTHEEPTVKCGWVTAILPLGDGSVWATTYGGGLARLQGGKGEFQTARIVGGAVKTEARPAPVAVADVDPEAAARGIESILQQPARGASPVVYSHEDWSTLGDWCERYGIDFGMLCAANAPWQNGVCYDHYRLVDREVDVYGHIGPHKTPDDELRYWVQWPSAPHNRNVLYGPNAAIRTESEWSDHGEAYPATFDGPDVWTVVKVPQGGGDIALYFYNPNAREHGNNARRDYLVEVRKYESEDTSIFSIYQMTRPLKPEERALREAKRPKMLEEILGKKVLARTRVRSFAGAGVYKTFRTSEGGTYFIRIVRNNSFNTIVNGVFVSGHQLNPRRVYIPYAKVPLKPEAPEVPDDQKQFVSLWERGGQKQGLAGAALSRLHRHRLELYRYFLRRKIDTAYFRWGLSIWNDDDHNRFDEVMFQAWVNTQGGNPFLRSSEWCKYSPNTIPFSVDEVEAMHKMGVDWKQYLPSYGKKPDIPAPELKQKIKEYLANNKKES